MFQRLLSQVWKLSVALRDSDAKRGQYSKILKDTDRLLQEAEAMVVSLEVAS